MKGHSFRERLLDSTRGQILTLLRASPRTVTALAGELRLTDNAVRTHLMSLERDGFVQRHGMEPGVRRPHVMYGLAPAAEQVFPKAYGPLLNHLVGVISKRLSPAELRSAMRDVGRAVARDFIGDLPQKSAADRLAGALNVLSTLGGAATVHEENGKAFIRGDNCPLSAVTADHPQGCLIAETLLTELTGVPVKERCVREPRLRCSFELVAPAAKAGNAEPRNRPA